MADIETIEVDVLIIGAGPAGLSAAIKLKQLASKQNTPLSVCVLEKGAQVGAHLLSGAVLDPRVLQSLLPDTWQNAPLDSAVNEDKFYYLSARKAYRLPIPASLRNQGNYMVSIGELCQFLALEAESLGCDIYSGFTASKVLYGHAGEVVGVVTGEVGIDKLGHKTANYQPGMPIHAKQTIFAEGCRGELSQQVIKQFQLNAHANPQTYGLGIKELWEIQPNNHHEGKVIHTIGWPLTHSEYGGSFIYHLSKSRVAIGFVVGLDYTNPWLDPFAEMQRFKTHPFIKTCLEGGERIQYGARALNEGGWQSLPKLSFPGGVLVGDAAGFLHVPKIKGIHLAMQSGILAAKACINAFKSKNTLELTGYTKRFNQSWMAKELYQVRNVRPGFRYGLWLGLINAALELYLFKGRLPWTLKNHADNLSLKAANSVKPINYPKPDGVLTFDKLSSVYLSNTFHDSNQARHLKLNNPSLAISVNYKEYASPETRYCPANVYELVMKESEPQLVINAQNCLHCKTCDIKDPRQNIYWTAPEGGGGPNYSGM